MRSRAGKVNIPMCAACVLLCLTLFSVSLAGGLYARYAVTNEMNDSARIAKFSVTEAGEILSGELRLHVVPGEDTTAVITVKNDSEVDVRYTISADNPFKNLPIRFEAGDGEGDHYVIKPGAQKDCTLTVLWEGDPDIKYVGRVDLIKLTVKTEQID